LLITAEFLSYQLSHQFNDLAFLLTTGITVAESHRVIKRVAEGLNNGERNTNVEIRNSKQIQMIK
jgi:hypothetical protein